MGAAIENNTNNKPRVMKKNGFVRGRKGQRRGPNFNQPPSLLSQPMRRPPFPGRMPPLGMRPMLPGPVHGIRPPPMRGMPPPNRMGPGPRGPPFGMRPLPPPPPHHHAIRPQPRMRPPPGMIRPMMPPLPMMPHGGPGPRGFRPGLPPPLIPPNKMRRIQKGRVVKKKRIILKDIDLAKPWVTEHIKTEFSKKEELLKNAKDTQNASDWSIYREQREKCNKVYTTAKMKYIGQHPEEVRIPQLMPEANNVPVITAPIDYTADVQLQDINKIMAEANKNQSLIVTKTVTSRFSIHSGQISQPAEPVNTTESINNQPCESIHYESTEFDKPAVNEPTTTQASHQIWVLPLN